MKHCLNCGKPFKKWGNLKKCCTKKCTDAYYQKTNPESHQKSWRKYNDRNREKHKISMNNYYKTHKKRYEEYNKIHRLENNARTRAKYAMKKANIRKVCSDCNTDQFIHVHHIDHNPFNNTLENLIYLCSIHHGKRHIKSLEYK